MLAYRLTPQRTASRAFSGEGARLYGGRWNRVGTPMIYASESRALATLEVLAHFRPETAPSVHFLYEVELPDGAVETLAPLPRGWDDPMPALDSPAARAGSRWADSLRSLALRVPSVVVPAEYNLLLNPRHPDFGRIRVARPTRFDFDPRLVAPRG